MSKIEMEGTALLLNHDTGDPVIVKFSLDCKCGARLEYEGPYGVADLLDTWRDLHVGCESKRYVQPPLPTPDRTPPWPEPRPYRPFWTSDSAGPYVSTEFTYEAQSDE